jgi:hypothetical protein
VGAADAGTTSSPDHLARYETALPWTHPPAVPDHAVSEKV